MTATRDTGRTNSDTAMRGALLVGVAVIVGALLLWRGHDDDAGQVTTAGAVTTTRAASATTAAPGSTVAGGAGGAAGGTPTTVAGGSATTAGGAPAATRQPAQIKVLVANGANKSGYAGQVNQRLTTFGYGTLGPENANVTGATKIFYREGYVEDAKNLAKNLGVGVDIVELIPSVLTDRFDAPVASRAAQANIVIILGTDEKIK
jgi:hypothetical protein